MQILNPSRWYLHPVFILTCSILALATFLVLTVSWYMEITRALEQVILKFHIDPIDIFPSKTGMTILILIALIAVVLAGMLLAFIYYQKTVNLFRLQHNFIYNFTHELKTPVTSLRIYLETFIRHPLGPEDIRKYSENMLEDIKRLNDNITSILNLARIESRNIGSEVSKVSLVTLVEKFCRENASVFRGMDIRIDRPASESPFVLAVNRFLFDMLLMNIFSNAAKYNDSKKPELTVRFRSLVQKRTIEFTDNGIGVEKKEQKKIFKKFYQSERENKKGVSGSGLGLYLVSSIAGIHGWKAYVTSEGRSRGSTFVIAIPRTGLADIREKQLWKRLKKSVSWS